MLRELNADDDVELRLHRPVLRRLLGNRGRVGTERQRCRARSTRRSISTSCTASENWRHRAARAFSKLGNRLKHFAQRRWTFAKHRWISAAAWHVTRIFLPRSYSEDILEKLGDDGIDLLLFYGIEEVWPYNEIPFFRTLDLRRLKPTSIRRVEYVPGLDHGMHSADGRVRDGQHAGRTRARTLRWRHEHHGVAAFFTEESVTRGYFEAAASRFAAPSRTSGMSSLPKSIVSTSGSKPFSSKVVMPMS